MSQRVLGGREQIWVALLFLVGFTFIYWSLLFHPLYRAWQESLQNTELEQHRLIEKLKTLQQKEWIEEHYLELTKYLKVKGSDEQEIGRFQDEVGAFAKQVGVKVNKTKPRPIETQPGTKRCYLELDCTGSLTQLSEFVYRMQTSPQALRVLQWHLSLENQRESILRSSFLVSKILIVE